jgi:anti-sigma factor RsiW
MNTEQQLKLQAFLDGELPEAEAREIANWIANDQEAAALQTELKNTRKALSGHEADIKMPESREFYWSKIRRAISIDQPVEKAAPELSLMGQLLRVFMPASALAIVAITALVAAKNFGLLKGSAPATPELQTALNDPGAFTYRDEQEGMTVVWLSYNENRLAN